MKIDESGIEFNNVLRATTSINDTKKTVKMDACPFSNSNSKGDFKQINSIDELKELHKLGLESAKNTFALMNS